MRTRSYTLDDIRAVLGTDMRIVGEPSASFLRPASFDAAQSHEICFHKGWGPEALAILRTSPAAVVVCHDVGDLAGCSATFVVVPDARSAFVRIVSALFQNKRPTGIAQGAIVDPAAQIDPSAYIGPGALVGVCIVGSGSVIGPNTVLHDGVRIGRNVTINAGTVLGADGFGYTRLEDGSMEKFEHFGGVVIEDDVEIGSNTSVDRGTLGDTIIRRGAKIDNQIHIAHNCDVGEDAVIIAQSMIGGSVKIGARAWIAPSVTIMNGLTIGPETTCGLGSVVTKDVAAGLTVMGNPARPRDQALRLLDAQKRQIAGNA